MKAVILASLLIVSYVSASPLINEELEDEAGSRQRRAAEGASHWDLNKPEQIGSAKLKCSAGKYAKLELDESGNLKLFQCVQCEPGTYVPAKGRFKSCVPCDNDLTTPEGSNEMCTAGCDVGKGWNKEKKKCDRCDANTFNDVQGSMTECRKCPKFHVSKKGAEKCTMNCPAGYEPNEDKSSCRLCKFGTFKSKADKKGVNGYCTSCCGDQEDCNFKWTLTNGADSKQQCVKMSHKQKQCFEPLMEALTEAAKFMKKEDEEERRLHRALCRMPNVDLEALKTHYDQCKEETGKQKNKVETKLLPKLLHNGDDEAVNDDDDVENTVTDEGVKDKETDGDVGNKKFMDFDRVFASGEIRACEDEDVIDGSGEGGGGKTTSPGGDGSSPPPHTDGDGSVRSTGRHGSTRPSSTGAGGSTRPPPTGRHGSTRLSSTGAGGSTRQPPTGGHGSTRPSSTGAGGSTRPPPTGGHGSTRPSSTGAGGSTRQRDGSSRPPTTGGAGSSHPPSTGRTDSSHPPPTGRTGSSHPPPTGRTGSSHPAPTGRTGSSHPPPTGGASSSHPPPTGGAGGG